MRQEVIIIVIVLGGTVLMSAIVSIALRRYSKNLESNQKNNLAWLQQNGKRITAYVMEVTGGEGNTSAEANIALDAILGSTPQQLSRDMHVASMGTSSYHVRAQWTDPKTQHTYTFYKTVSRDALPKHYVPGRDVTFEVTVLINPNNPKIYVVELPASQ